MDDLKFEAVKKIAETRFKYKALEGVSSLNTTSPPSVFIGSKLRYPAVNVGILSPIESDENAWVYDNAKYWADNNFSIKNVVNLRENLLNSRFRGSVTDSRSGKNRFIEIAQQIALGSRPVDVEIELKRNVSFNFRKDRVSVPQGLKGELKKARITGNVKIERKVDKVINDELKASKGIEYLYKNKFSEYVLSKILSVGVLGLKKDKKLVPTRWSITATDDMIGKKLIEKIKTYRWIENYELFFGEFMGNCYIVMFLPNVWSYELFELYLPGSSWNPGSKMKASTDFESYGGRRSYASNTAGGYYASRLPILEYLEKERKQASVLVVRLELPSYWASLGVWVVRESVRKALKNKKLEFDDLRELIEGSEKIGMIKFGYDPKKVLKTSRLLEQVKTQTNLGKWF